MYYINRLTGRLEYMPDQVASGGAGYVHPSSHSASMIEEAVDRRFMTDKEKSKLAGVAENANNYSHPAKHPASMIEVDEDRQFLSAAERNYLNGLQPHPAKHPASMIVEGSDRLFMTAREREKMNQMGARITPFEFSCSASNEGYMLRTEIPLPFPSGENFFFEFTLNCNDGRIISGTFSVNATNDGRFMALGQSQMPGMFNISVVQHADGYIALYLCALPTGTLSIVGWSRNSLSNYCQSDPIVMAREDCGLLAEVEFLRGISVTEHIPIVTVSSTAPNGAKSGDVWIKP